MCSLRTPSPKNINCVVVERSSALPRKVRSWGKHHRHAFSRNAKRPRHEMCPPIAQFRSITRRVLKERKEKTRREMRSPRTKCRPSPRCQVCSPRRQFRLTASCVLEERVFRSALSESISVPRAYTNHRESYCPNAEHACLYFAAPRRQPPSQRSRMAEGPRRVLEERTSKRASTVFSENAH